MGRRTCYYGPARLVSWGVTKTTVPASHGHHLLEVPLVRNRRLAEGSLRHDSRPGPYAGNEVMLPNKLVTKINAEILLKLPGIYTFNITLNLALVSLGS